MFGCCSWHIASDLQVSRRARICPVKGKSNAYQGPNPLRLNIAVRVYCPCCCCKGAVWCSQCLSQVPWDSNVTLASGMCTLRQFWAGWEGVTGWGRSDLWYQIPTSVCSLTQRPLPLYGQNWQRMNDMDGKQHQKANPSLQEQPPGVQRKDTKIQGRMVLIRVLSA